jgi:hypothetical protein
MAAPTLYQKRTAAKRGSRDIARLAEQYKRGIQSVSSEYEQAFGAYQAKTAETLAPYEAAIKKYQESTLPQYESAAATYEAKAKEYQSKVSSYQDLLKSYAVDPQGRRVTMSNYAYGNVYTTNYPGTKQQVNFAEAWKYNPTNLPESSFVEGYSGQSRWVLPSGWEWVPDVKGQTGYQATGYLRKSGVTTPFEQFTQRTAPGAFTEKAPAAPEAPPSAPTIESFSDEPFQQKRAGLESEFQRELGERKSARISAVSRRSSRPLMQG